jgi:hypothetical protein
MGEAVSKVADPVNCCGARKPDIKDGPNANPKNKTGGGGGTDAIIGGDAFGGLFGRKLQLDPGQLVISDACYKGNLDEVGLVPSCAPHAPARNSFCQGGGAPPPAPRLTLREVHAALLILQCVPHPRLAQSPTRPFGLAQRFCDFSP